VGDDLMGLYAKTKTSGRLLEPVLNRRLFYQLPKSKVHFDRVELSRVVAEKFFLREFGGIKVRLPA
jgi:hypothetical protein